MFDTIRRSFRLAKLCLHVLAADKELVFFPVFSSIGVVVVLLTFMGTWLGIGALGRIGAGGLGVSDIVLAFAFYVLAYFVIIFFNCALVFAAHERLSGGDPNIRSGLRGAWYRVITIFMWAVIAGTVGLILKILSGQAGQRGGILGIVSQIVIALLGAAWTLITYFVVPLIVIERRPLGDAFKTSISLFRRTWGEQVVGNFGLGIAAFLAYLVAAGIIVLLFLALSPLGGVGIAVTSIIGVVLVIGVALVFATMDGIYKAALYTYASTGEVPSLFPDDSIRQAFRPRES
jgi:hypothetical protein